MEKIKCEKCGKVIHGYTKNQVEYLLEQHKLSRHRRFDEDGKKEKE